jgi:hypothetical protein
MDFSQFKKPWVIYTGLGLGALILLSSLGKGANSAAPQSTAQALSYQEAMNQAGMAFMQHQYDASVQYEQNRFNADVQMQALTIATLTNLSAASDQSANQFANVQAGITGTILQNNLSASLERQMMPLRMALFNVAVNQSQGTSSATPQIQEQNTMPASLA